MDLNSDNGDSCESPSSPSSESSEDVDSGTQSESDISSQPDCSDPDFRPEDTDLDSPEDEPDLFSCSDSNLNRDTASKHTQKKQLKRDPIPGDGWREHAINIGRLLRQAEASGKHCYLGPAIGWDEEKLLNFLRSIDQEIPDAVNITGTHGQYEFE
jgi:hypothetical protein